MWIITIVIRLEDHFCDNLEILSRSVEERMTQNTLSIERLDREREQAGSLFMPLALTKSVSSNHLPTRSILCPRD